MVMSILRKGAAGGIIKFILFGLLVLATGGMVFMDVGGFFRGGGLASSDVAKIGPEKISIQQFDRMARRTLQRVGMTTEQAYKMNYMHEMLAGEIRARLLAMSAHDQGVSVGHDEVVKKVQELIAPMVQPGQQPHEVLGQVLQSQGMSEQELSHSIRREMATNLLGDAVKAGFADVSDNMVADLATYEKEQRGIEFIVFPDKEFTGSKAPEEAELQQMYEATKEAYANPELREGQLIILNNANLKSTLDISDEELRDAYDRNVDAYSEPESRTLEIALLADAEKAAKVAEVAKSGKSLKDATKEVTGNTTDYLPPEKYTEKDLAADLQAEAFNAREGDIVGPIETALGQQVVVVKSINKARVQEFETVKADIRKELEETKLADAQFDLANNLDDALASGASPDEIKNQFDVEIKTIPAMSAMGTDKDGKSVAADFKDIGDKLLRSLFELNEGEASAIFDMPDGRMAAIVLKSVTPKTYKPFEEVKATLETQWTESTVKADNKLQVMKILADMKAENLGMQDIAGKYKKQTQSLAGIVRTKEPPAPLSMATMGSIFEAAEGDAITLDLENGSAIARITSVNAENGYTPEELSKARPNIVRSAQNESYEIFVEKARQRYGANVNDRLLEQTYGAREE